MTKWLLIDAMKVDYFKSFSNSEDISFGIGAMKKTTFHDFFPFNFDGPLTFPGVM